MGDVEPVGVEAHGHVEREAGGDRDARARRLSKVTTPVSASTLQPESCSAPSSATRTVPATGFVIVRVQLCAPEA